MPPENAPQIQVSEAAAIWNDRRVIRGTPAAFDLLIDSVSVDQQGEARTLQALMLSCANACRHTYSDIDPENVINDLLEAGSIIESFSYEDRNHLYNVLNPDGHEVSSVLGTVVGDIITMLTLFHNRAAVQLVQTANAAEKHIIALKLAKIETGIVSTMRIIESITTGDPQKVERIRNMIASFLTTKGIRAGYARIDLPPAFVRLRRTSAGNDANSRTALRTGRLTDEAWSMLHLSHTPVLNGMKKTFKDVWDEILESVKAYGTASQIDGNRRERNAILHNLVMQSTLLIRGLHELSTTHLQDLNEKGILGMLIGDIYTILSRVLKELEKQCATSTDPVQQASLEASISNIGRTMLDALHIMRRVTAHSSRLDALSAAASVGSEQCFDPTAD